MVDQYTAFAYKAGNSFLHKCPAWIKILFIPVISILFFYLPPVFSVILIVVQTFIAFLLKFTFKEQIKDLKPVIYYAILLVFTNFIVIIGTGQFVDFINDAVLYLKNPIGLLNIIRSNQTVLMLFKLFCVMQSTSLFFKTSTSVQIRRGLETIEKAIRKVFHLKPKTTVAGAIAMFLNFIPIVSKIWLQLKISWKARMGKNGIKMYTTLLPVFFSVGMKKAWNSARAVQIRE